MQPGFDGGRSDSQAPDDIGRAEFLDLFPDKDSAASWRQTTHGLAQSLMQFLVHRPPLRAGRRRLGESHHFFSLIPVSPCFHEPCPPAQAGPIWPRLAGRQFSTTESAETRHPEAKGFGFIAHWRLILLPTECRRNDLDA